MKKKKLFGILAVITLFGTVSHVLWKNEKVQNYFYPKFVDTKKKIKNAIKKKKFKLNEIWDAIAEIEETNTLEKETWVTRLVREKKKITLITYLKTEEESVTHTRSLQPEEIEVLTKQLQDFFANKKTTILASKSNTKLYYVDGNIEKLPDNFLTVHDFLW